jgi:CRISPR-associated protein Cmr1
MFLSGADGQTPELRPPSIKGALRFWWRAMNGHLVNTENGGIPNLLKEDERLFGGVNGGGKSSVLVRVFDLENENDFIDGNEIKRDCEQNDTKGLAYLFYILVNNQQKDRNGFRELKFKLSLSSASIEDLKKAVGSFWLFVHLGGLGSRARRGAGCIQITGIEKGSEYLIDENKKQIISFLPDETNDINYFYSENYKKCINILQKPNTPEGYLKDNDLYSTLTSNEIYISSSFPSWQEALDNIGLIMKEMRDYFTTENRKFKLKDIPKKAAFGLPIRIRDTKENIKKGIPAFEGYYVDLENSSRRASPLIISIFKQGKENDKAKYYWVLTYLDGIYSDNENAITIRNSKAKIHSKNGKEFKFLNADRSLITTFLNKLSKTEITI